MRRVCLGLLVALLAGCGNRVAVSSTAASSGASSATASTGAGAGGSVPALPACVSRLSGTETRPSFMAELSAEGTPAPHLNIEFIDVDAEGNVVFAGQP